MFDVRWFWALLALLVLSACDERKAVSAHVRGPATPLSTGSPAPGVSAPPRTPSCNTRLARLGALPALAGAPALEAARTRLLLSAKAEPALFLEPPQPDDGGTQARALRQQLGRGMAMEALGRVMARLDNRPELARAVLLREGYLYAESPGLGLALVEQVKLESLFAEPNLVIMRGSTRFRVQKRDDRYRYLDGPHADEPARLLLFDRVWVEGNEPGPTRHVSLRGVSEQSGADEVKIQRLTREGVVAELRYGDRWVASLLSLHGPEAELACEVVDREAAEVVNRVRQSGYQRTRVVKALLRTIEDLADESLPFDEPKTEEGQQDGKLRPEWILAYENGRDQYEFNEDRYQVFDAKGRPRVPQVCIDFILDTLERASGRWWRMRGEPRERMSGKLNFEELGLRGRRSVDRFLDFATEHPEWFDVHRLVPEERIPLMRKAEFVAHIYHNRDRYRPGDIIVIHGLRDDDQNHYHSFYVVDADPITGIPTLVASNAGRPRIRTWETEMRNAPKRSILARIRPRLDWLEPMFLPQKSRH